MNDMIDAMPYVMMVGIACIALCFLASTHRGTNSNGPAPPGWRPPASPAPPPPGYNWNSPEPEGRRAPPPPAPPAPPAPATCPWCGRRIARTSRVDRERRP